MNLRSIYVIKTRNILKKENIKREASQIICLRISIDTVAWLESKSHASREQGNQFSVFVLVRNQEANKILFASKTNNRRLPHMDFKIHVSRYQEARRFLQGLEESDKLVQGPSTRRRLC